MPDIPAGTVTMLFTDIEGSTHLLKTLGRAYDRTLSDHRALLRRAFNLHGGQVVDRQGDSFFVVFRTAKDALAAAFDAQQALVTHPWPDGVNLRVRMGIDTGEPTIGDEGLTGLVVHRAARICGTADGEQILLSNTTRELVMDDLPAGMALREIGERVLKDFERPVRLFQVAAEETGKTLPPSAARLKETSDDASTDVRSETQPDQATARPAQDGIPLRTGIGLWLRLQAALLDLTPRPVRRRLGGDPVVIGSRIHSMSRLSPSPELKVALQELGGGVIQLARCNRDVRRGLAAADRRALTRRLNSLRNAHFLTDDEASLADDLARQVDALDRLSKLQPVVRSEIKRIDKHAMRVRREIFDARVGHPLPEGMVEQLKALQASAQSLCAEVRDCEQRAWRVADENCLRPPRRGRRSTT